MTLKVRSVDAAPNRVDFLWPKPPAKPQLEGFVMAHYRYHNQTKLDALQAQADAEEITEREHFQALVPQIDGCENREGKLLEGEAVYEFLDEDDLGQVIKAGILADYYSVIAEGKSRTSKKRRRRS